MTRVMLVDDHHLVRAGLVALLAAEPDLEVVAQAADGAEALELARQTRPDVVLMDLSMPVLDGAQATGRILAELPDTHIVVLTSFAGRERVADALAAGAVGYLLKDTRPEALVAAVRAAASGDAPLDPRVARTLLPPRPTTVAGDPAGGPGTPAGGSAGPVGGRRAEPARSSAEPPWPGPVWPPVPDEPSRDAAGTPTSRAAAVGLSAREVDVLRLVCQGLGNRQIGRALGITERTVKAHLGSVFRRIGVTDRTSAALWAAQHLFDASSP